jgi:ABC-type dipeptide/oligopeptide/nickel transport system permease component
VVQSVVLIVAFTYVIVNFVVDALYTLLDPRVRDLRAH